MRSSGKSSTGNSPRRLRAINSSKQSVVMTAMVGTLTSISGKAEASIVSASRSLAKANPLAFPPKAPVPIRVKRNVPSQKCRSNTGRSATTVLRSVIAASGRHHSRRGSPHHRKRKPRRPKRYTQPRSWQALATRPMAIAYAASRMDSFSRRESSETAKYAEVILRSSFPRTSSFSQK